MLQETCREDGSIGGIKTGATEAQDVYNFEQASLSIQVDQFLSNNMPGYVSYTKTLPLGRGGATLTVSVQVITDSNYHMIEFVISGAPSLDRAGGLGHSMGLWPYSSVWNLQRKTQAIYAAGDGSGGMIRDLETKFNGASGRVGFSATGDAATGGLAITMQNK